MEKLPCNICAWCAYGLGSYCLGVLLGYQYGFKKAKAGEK